MILQPKTNPDQTSLDAEPSRPLQLPVVRQDRVRTGEGEVRAKARALLDLEGVEEGGRRALRLAERDRQQAAVAAAGVAAAVVVGAARAVLRVVDVLDEWGGVEERGDGGGGDVDALDARDEVAAVALEEDGVFGPVVVLVLGAPGRLECVVQGPVRVQDGGAAHDVAVAAEGFGQAAHHDVGVRQHVDVDEVADRLVDHDGEAVRIGEPTDARQVWRAEERIAGELGEEGEEALAAVCEAALKVVEVGVGAVAVEEAAGPPLLEDLERVDIREAEADALAGFVAAAARHEDAVGVEDGAHAGWVEVDIIFVEAFDTAGGAVCGCFKSLVEF